MRRRHVPGKRRSHQGFTLIEVIAAFTILSMTFMVILEILSNSSANTIKSSERSQVAMLAQSLMDEVGILIPVEEGTVSGQFDERYKWDISIQPYEVSYEGNVAMDFAPVELFMVQLNISWQDNRDKRRSIVFSTLRAMTPDFQDTGVGR
ncbi:prepilin-type N-terminal cleavage/methylation domain-containing protein [Marinicella sediminis]|uniref:Prepilin-type N-terminal cleavage/methylation domain-containing protein n=1 Tax=Marinicella sediminis TaxID=1792834 RepID=A0ABV7J4N6_9GAMM|nr:prepilin-type N-terminal cleavage/methylation domain-containing protein [Marinicella sediminis]